MSVEKWISFWRTHERLGYHAEDCETIRSWMNPQDREIGSMPRSFPLNRKDQGKLHPALTPVPYVGNIRNATIIFAMLNPTVGRADYVDNSKEEFHDLLRRNRLQENVTDCFAVDNKSSALSWYEYFRPIFRSAVQSAAGISHVSEDSMWEALRRRLAIVELIPYYSQNASILLQKGRYADLKSVIYAQEAMEEIRNRPNTTVICRWKRSPNRWKMPANTYICSTARAGLSADARQAVCANLVEYLKS
jgi:hypothetical protein